MCQEVVISQMFSNSSEFIPGVCAILIRRRTFPLTRTQKYREPFRNSWGRGLAPIYELERRKSEIEGLSDLLGPASFNQTLDSRTSCVDERKLVGAKASDCYFCGALPPFGVFSLKSSHLWPPNPPSVPFERLILVFCH